MTRDEFFKEAEEEDFDIVNGEYISQTEKAVHINVKGHGEKWIPKSVTNDFDWDDWEPGDIVEFECANWFTEKEGL